MENVGPVPTPFFDKIEQNKTEENQETSNEVTDFSQIIENNFLFSCSKKGDQIIFKAEKQEAIIPLVYELSCSEKYLKNASKILGACDFINEIYNALINGLKNNSNSIKIDTSSGNAVCNFQLDYGFINKKENIPIILYKKKAELDFELLNNAFNEIKNNQNNLEDKLDKKVIEINLVIEKQSKLQDEFNQKLKEFEEIKNYQKETSKYLENYKLNNIDIEKSKNDFKLDLENMKKEMNNTYNLNKEEVKNEIKGIKAIVKNQKNELVNSFSKQNSDIQDLSEKFLKFEDSLKEKNGIIFTLQKNYEELSKVNKELNEKIERTNSYIALENKKIIEKIKQNNSYLSQENQKTNKKFEETRAYIDLKIEKLIQENEDMKKKINDLNHKYSTLNKTILGLIKEQRSPTDFEYEKTISSNLFKKNFYNNRACLFASQIDNKVYVAFGETSLNLVCYDIIDDKKFTIIENLHENNFDTCRYFYDSNKKRDLLITASLDAHVKLINFKRDKSTKIMDLNFQSKNAKVIINTSYILNDIILIPISSSTAGTIKFYNMDAEYISELEENAGFILGLNTFYDQQKKENYILIANDKGILSYNMEQSSIMGFIPKMTEEKENNGFDEPYVIKKNNKLLLVGPCFYYGFIFLWDFYNRDLIKTIKTSSGISDINFWDNNYIFAGMVHSKNESFILINIEKGEIEKKFELRKPHDVSAGVKVLKHESGNYLISATMSGDLNLFVMN